MIDDAKLAEWEKEPEEGHSRRPGDTLMRAEPSEDVPVSRGSSGTGGGWLRKFSQIRVHHVTWRLFCEPRDIWIGLYWKRYPSAIDLYLCMVPMLPLNVYLQWQRLDR